MTSDLQDPAVQWSKHLDRLDGVRLHSVAEALRHSARTGWPASEESVRLLVDYAVGDITSRQYVDGILRASGVPVPASPVVRREDAVAAYVSGQIPVGEFLRIARQHG